MPVNKSCESGIGGGGLWLTSVDIQKARNDLMARDMRLRCYQAEVRSCVVGIEALRQVLFTRLVGWGTPGKVSVAITIWLLL